MAARLKSDEEHVAERMRRRINGFRAPGCEKCMHITRGSWHPWCKVHFHSPGERKTTQADCLDFEHK